ncbi:MAG: pyrroloquinoline quinone biosynthesis peptide chaperone PqqD [Betaproteobacteria bacterium]|nr:MAG: pyrroloquinoline quinone biosynthesis peptide chaperone PqqD [Betaproteobacteria bacterium]
MQPAARPKVSSKFRLQWEEAQGAWVLLYPEGMVRLNASAGEIMKRCDGRRTVDELVAELEQAFDASGLQGEVTNFLDMARKQHWIEV